MRQDIAVAAKHSVSANEAKRAGIPLGEAASELQLATVEAPVQPPAGKGELDEAGEEEEKGPRVSVKGQAPGEEVPVVLSDSSGGGDGPPGAG